MLGMIEDREITNLLLKQLHNDILVVHLSMTVDKMHKMGMVDDENYKKILSSTYKIIDDQIRGMAKDLNVSHPEQSS